MSLESWAQLATVLAALASLIAVVISLRAHNSNLRQQNKIHTFNALLQIHKELGEAWENLTKSSEENWEFYFGQLLSLYETTCYMFNNKLLGNKIENLIKDHIIEVITNISSDEKCLAEMRRLSSGRDSYREIIIFFRNNKHAYQEHWKYLQEVGWKSK